MSEIKIKCPSCGKILRVQDAPDIDSRTLTCPVCKTRHIVGDCQRYVEQSVGKTTCSGETKLPDPERTNIAAPDKASVGTLVDTHGRTYPLSAGVNTVGRMAKSSAATVQIDTKDKAMSRSHAIIEVQNVGGQIIHILKNGTNQNPSYINGTIIGPSDQLVLNNGDRITLGMTELTFKR